MPPKKPPDDDDSASSSASVEKRRPGDPLPPKDRAFLRAVVQNAVDRRHYLLGKGFDALYHSDYDARLLVRCLESSLEDPRYSQEYLNHVIFASPEEVVLTAPDGSLGASERTAE